MSLVVFLRGVNVGGNKVFRPAELAERLAPRDVTSVGAAGTFVAHGETDAEALRAAIAAELPFEADIIVRPADEVLALVDRSAFADEAEAEDAKPFVSVLAEVPKDLPAFPIDAPEGDEWEVRVLGVEGAFAMSLRRAAGGKFYPNEVVEKRLGVRATTRGWSTFETLASRIEKK